MYSVSSSRCYSKGSKASTKKIEYGGVKAGYSPTFAIPKRRKRSDRDSYKEDARCSPKTQRKDEADAAKRPVLESSKDHVHHIVKDVSNLIGRPVVLTHRGLWATRSRSGKMNVVLATASKEGAPF